MFKSAYINHEDGSDVHRHGQNVTTESGETHFITIQFQTSMLISVDESDMRNAAFEDVARKHSGLYSRTNHAINSLNSWVMVV